MPPTTKILTSVILAVVVPILVLPQGAAQPVLLTKEYVYVGGRLLAVEVPLSSTGITLTFAPISPCPDPIELTALATCQIQAVVTGAPGAQVTWAIESGPGSIDNPLNNPVQYTAPASIATTQTVLLRATVENTQPVVTEVVSITLKPMIITVPPPPAPLNENDTHEFTPVVTGGSYTTAAWTVVSGLGQFDPPPNSNRYRAPASIPSSQTATVQVMLDGDPAKTATAIVQLEPTIPPEEPSGLSIQGFSITPSDILYAGVTRLEINLSVRIENQADDVQIDFYLASNPASPLSGYKFPNSHVFPGTLHSQSNPVAVTIDPVPAAAPRGFKYVIAHVHQNGVEPPTVDCSGNTACSGQLQVLDPPPPTPSPTGVPDLFPYLNVLTPSITTAEVPALWPRVQNLGEDYDPVVLFTAQVTTNGPSGFGVANTWNWDLLDWDNFFHSAIDDTNFGGGTYIPYFWPTHLNFLNQGSHTATLNLDINSAIAESNESNNSETNSFQVVPVPPGSPDLVLSAITPPAGGAVALGQSVNITATVSETALEQAGQMSVSVYLSTDTTIDTSDLLLDSCSFQTLAAGASQDCVINPTIPTNIAVGNYYLGARVVNEDAIILEQELNNNSASVAQYVQAPPSAVSISPTAGSGFTATFTATYSDPNGVGDIRNAYLMINSNVLWQGSCGFLYQQPSGVLRIIADGGMVWSAGIVPGSGSLSNSTCSVDGTGVSVNAVGNTLSISIPVTFTTNLGSSRKTFLYADDHSPTTLASGWQQKGIWTIPGTFPNQPPTAVAIDPKAGQGLSREFVLTARDPNGYEDITMIQWLLNTGLAYTGACGVLYNNAADQIFLINDQGNSWGNGLAPGSVGTLSNSTCSIPVAGVSVNGSGDELVLNLPVDLVASPVVQRNGYLIAYDFAGVHNNWQQLGTWLNQDPTNAAPEAVSVTPNAGSTASQRFEFVWRDLDGATNIEHTQAIFRADATSGANACIIAFNQPANTFFLLDDDGSTPIPLVPGYAHVENSQCIVHGENSWGLAAGTDLTVSVQVLFKSAFGGLKNIYMWSQDLAGYTEGWIDKGDWTVPSMPNQPPSTISVSPSSGTGAGQTFSFVWRDPEGGSEIKFAHSLFRTDTTAFDTACYVEYNQLSNNFFLRSDDGASWLPAITAGSGSTENSQCRLDGAGSGAVVSGQDLIVTMNLSFKAGFAGTQNVYMWARDLALNDVGWNTLGSYVVVSPDPEIIAVSPSSGTGGSQLFTITTRDGNGGGDINWVQFLINDILFGGSGCYVHTDTASNTIQLRDDTGSNWLPAVGLGSPTVTENGRCAVSAGSSQGVVSGNDYVLTLDVTFKPPFAGTKNLYGRAYDGLTDSGWTAPIGNWTIPSNQPPNVTPIANQTNIEGATISLQVAATDPESDPLTYGATGLPAGLSINSTSGLIYGTIAASTAGNYNVTVSVADPYNAPVTTPFTWTVTAPPATGTITREYWTGINGTAVSNLTSHPNYPNNPSGTGTLTSFQAPSGWGNNFGDRVRGYLHPPTTGSYTFWIASDETSELWLSTDDNPANAVKIAWVVSKTSAQEWDDHPQQQSAAITLTAGQRYYIHALRKEANGQDHLAVAWQGPGITQQVIAGQYLSPWDGGQAQLVGPRDWIVAVRQGPTHPGVSAYLGPRVALPTRKPRQASHI